MTKIVITVTDENGIIYDRQEVEIEKPTTTISVRLNGPGETDTIWIWQLEG